jgi:hypothetical protein
MPDLEEIPEHFDARHNLPHILADHWALDGGLKQLLVRLLKPAA